MKRKEATREKDDWYRHRLGLACIALAEVPAPVRGRMSDWVDRLTKEAYELYERPVRERSASEVEYFKPSIVAMGQLNGRIGTTRFIDSRLPMAYLQNPNEPQKWFEVLGEAAATPDVVRTLVRAVTDEAYFAVRWGAAEALGKLSKAAATPEVVSALVRAVADDADFHVRSSAAEALGGLDEAAATSEAVSVLVRAVADDADSHVREGAARALGGLGEAAATPEVVSGLVRVVTDDTDSDVRFSAACALFRFDKAAATPK